MHTNQCVNLDERIPRDGNGICGGQFLVTIRPRTALDADTRLRPALGNLADVVVVIDTWPHACTFQHLRQDVDDVANRVADQVIAGREPRIVDKLNSGFVKRA